MPNSCFRAPRLLERSAQPVGNEAERNCQSEFTRLFGLLWYVNVLILVANSIATFIFRSTVYTFFHSRKGKVRCAQFLDILFYLGSVALTLVLYLVETYLETSRGAVLSLAQLPFPKNLKTLLRSFLMQVAFEPSFLFFPSLAIKQDSSTSEQLKAHTAPARATHLFYLITVAHMQSLTLPSIP